MSQKYVCGRTGIALKKEQDHHATYKAIPLLCKSWDCEPCRRYKAEQYRERMKQLFDGRQLFMYTLTYYHNQVPSEAWRTYNAAWNRLRTAWSKLYGRFSYVRVLESHDKSPYPHLHVIATADVPEGDFGRLCVQSGFGYQVRKVKVSDKNAVFYISKYLTKEWTNEESKKYRKENHCRIISFSADIRSIKHLSASWEVVGKYATFVDAVVAIYADAEFRNDTRATVTYRRVDDKSAEISFEFEDVIKPHKFVRINMPTIKYVSDVVIRKPCADTF